MVVFILGSDSGFQIGADGILDDYDDEGGISVVLWCIIFVFLLVVTIWFYISQLTPRNTKCLDDEDNEDEEERVANKLLNQIRSGKYDSKNSPRGKENIVCRPSTSRENSSSYEVIDGEVRIHHSNYEWENEPGSMGNETDVREMSESLVRRPSMEEMSLIFPGVLPSIIEEEEEEDGEIHENHSKDEGQFDRAICDIRDLEGDTAEGFSNISVDSNIYKAADDNRPLNGQHDQKLDQTEKYITTAHGIDTFGRQITNRKGKQPAKIYKATTEILLRCNKISKVPAVATNVDKSCPDKMPQASEGWSVKDSDVTNNTVSVLQLEKTLCSSQNKNSLVPISGLKGSESDPKDQSRDRNKNGNCFKFQKETTSTNLKDFEADKSRSGFVGDEKILAISTPLNSYCYVNKESNENIICIETSDANLQNEPDKFKSLDNSEEIFNADNEPSVGHIPKEAEDLPLSNGLKSSTFKGSESMSNQLKHAWTFFSMAENYDNQMNGNDSHKDTSLIKTQDQKIPTIVVVKPYDENKDVNNIEKDTWARSARHLDSFETDVDDVELEEEYENNEGEFNMFLKRHVSVTDLDKVLSSNENIHDKKCPEGENFESEVEEGNLETIADGINICSENKRVYTESCLDDIWNDYDCIKNGAPTQNVKHLAEMSKKTSKTCLNKKINNGIEHGNEFIPRQATLNQNTDNCEKVIEDGHNDCVETSLGASPVKNKKRDVDVTVSTIKTISTSKGIPNNLHRKKENDEKEPEKIDKHSLADYLGKNMPELKKFNEGESSSSVPIVNEFSVINISDSCKRMNKSGFDHDNESNKSNKRAVEDVIPFVDGELILETITPNRKDHFQDILKINEPENAGEFSRSDVAKNEGTVRDYSPITINKNLELSKSKTLEKRSLRNMERPGSIADKNTNIVQNKGAIEDVKKKYGDIKDRVVGKQDSNHINLSQPVSLSRREDVIYGRRKMKKEDGSGKRADFILKLNEMSRNTDSESDDNGQLGKEVVESFSSTLSGNSKSSSHSEIATQESHDKVTHENEKKIHTLNVTQSSETIAPEVNKPLEFGQESLGVMEAHEDAGATEEYNISEREILSNGMTDGSYRVERRNVQPKIEKSILLNPEKNELQTLIKIDQIPDTHIGLEICIPGRFDVEQNKPITGLEKAEQIVANRLKRIEAEKKAAEEIENSEKIKEAHKETRQQKDYIPRRANYDEARYPRVYREKQRGMLVDERVTFEESMSRNIRWNDFKLDDITLKEIDIPGTHLPINDVADDFDLQCYQEKPTSKQIDSSEQMVEEWISSEVFTPQKIDWRSLELSSGKENKETKTVVVGNHFSCEVNKYQNINSLETDQGKDNPVGVALQMVNARGSQKEVNLKNPTIKIESSKRQEEREFEFKPKQCYHDKQMDSKSLRKKRSDVLKKKICDELSNMDPEVEVNNYVASTVSCSDEPKYPVRQTKSFSELRSMGRDSRGDADTFRPSARSSDPPGSQEPGVAPSSDEETFSESQKRVFKTRVTVDEVRGNKRRITIINIRKKSPGNTRCKSLNDIDSLSTGQKQVFKFTSISSLSGEDKTPPKVLDSSTESGKTDEDTVFSESGLISKKLDSANKSEDTMAIRSTDSLQDGKEMPLMNKIDKIGHIPTRRHKDKEEEKIMPHESYCSRPRSSKETFISPTCGIPKTTESYIFAKETVFKASAETQNTVHSTHTGYHSKEEKSTVKRLSSLSPVTVQTSGSSSTGTVFALSQHSPTLSDSEKNSQEKITTPTQPSVSPETVQTSPRSPTGTLFALSRHGPTPFSDSEKKKKENRKEDKAKERQISMEKKPTLERTTPHYGASRIGTFFAVSRYSPATSDSENQGSFSTPKSQTELQCKYQTKDPYTRGSTVPSRTSSKNPFVGNKEEKDKSKTLVTENDGLSRIQDNHEHGKLHHETRRLKAHKNIKESRREEVKSAAPEKTGKETTFHVNERDLNSSPGNTFTKLTSLDDKHRKETSTLSSTSDDEYIITTDGWLKKIPVSSTPKTDDRQNKIVKVTNMDSLSGVTSSSRSVTKERFIALEKRKATSVVSVIASNTSRDAEDSRSMPSDTEPEISLHTKITSTGVPETDLDALFAAEEVEDLSMVQYTGKAEEAAESRTSLLRKTVVSRNGKIMVTKENYKTSEKRQPLETDPCMLREAEESQEAPVIQAISLSESAAFGDLDDDVFTQSPVKHGIDQNSYRADGTYSSDADSETSSLNSLYLKPKTRHTRSSLEAVKSTVRAPRSPLSSDSSSAPTPAPLERKDIDCDPFHHVPRSKTVRSKRDYPLTSFVASRKATTESGYHEQPITAEGNGFPIDSLNDALQKISRAHSENQVGKMELRRSAFTPVRHRDKEMRSNSQEQISSKSSDKLEVTPYNDSIPELNAHSTFKEMANSHKSMPDLHKPQSEVDVLSQKVPYHSRLSAHTRLWLSQTAGIDTSNLCKDDTVGSEIFLFPSNRFQPGKSVDASFISIASDTDDIPDDVSTRPSSPMSEFSFAGEAPFGGDYQGDVIVVSCGNACCGRDEIVSSHDKTTFTSCPSCFTYYCSSECRRVHWKEHKIVCYFGRINSYMRSFIYFCHKKENLRLLLSKIATKNYSSKGLGCVMVTFASPKQARKFMTSGCILLPSPPSYSTLCDLQQEGVVSKHKVNLIQQVKDYDPYQELVLNLAIIAGKVADLPIYPVPRHKLNTVLQCIRIPLCDSLIQRPKTVIPDTSKEMKVFYLPKCSRHEFVNDMEARRHYCRNISKSLREYGIKMKKDYPEAYDSLCLYVEKNVPFKPLTVYGNKDSKIIMCKIMPEGYTSSTLI